LLDELGQRRPGNLAVLLEQTRLAAKRRDASRLNASIARSIAPIGRSRAGTVRALAPAAGCSSPDASARAFLLCWSAFRRFEKALWRSGRRQSSWRTRSDGS
jgi:hypothetical protein